MEKEARIVEAVNATGAAFRAAYLAGMNGKPCPCLNEAAKRAGEPHSEVMEKIITLIDDVLRYEYMRGTRAKTQ